MSVSVNRSLADRRQADLRPEPTAERPLAERVAEVRAATLALAEPLSEADAQVQSMPDTSPAKWHLAHVTWFFETFVLERFERGFAPFHPAYRVLYNSYYEGVGARHPRPERGLVTRPSLAEVRAWRADVDARIAALLRDPPPDTAVLVELGLQHEQQHQELLLTDLLHAFSCNPLAPAYREPEAAPGHRGIGGLGIVGTGGAEGTDGAGRPAGAAHWLPFEGGVVEIGHALHERAGFAFDNESPRHLVFRRPYALADRPVTQREWLAFVEDGGYRDPRWWQSAGLDAARTRGWEAPMHWRRGEAGWSVFTLRGEAPLEPDAPVSHVSWYEADAYARWLGAQCPGEPPPRLPLESEWEHGVARQGPAAIAAGRFAEGGALRPLPAPAGEGLLQAFGDVWQWTRSDYAPYPGFRPWAGAVGEYNAKFMSGQYVLRGASCATPRAHARLTYRNFFPPDARWQFSGLRLARDQD
jgi:ergothioneine biosynthesis protein EgtB